MLKIIIPFLVILLASIAYATSQDSLESLSGIQFLKQSLTIQVISNGCTKAEHFAIREVTEKGVSTLGVIRTKKDYCRAMPRTMRFDLPFKAEGKFRYIIKNNFIYGD